MKNNLLSIDEYRNNPEFYFCKGLRCANKKNINDAYKNLQKALELEPDNCEYKFNFACFLSEMHQPKAANLIFNDILLNFDPTMYDCYFGLACNSFEIGDIEKSAEYFEKYMYFDIDGEFNEEVEEMIFYLKLYDGIAHNKKFIIRSNNSMKRANKYLLENEVNKATTELYKAVISNPSNLHARNLLTLALIEQQKFRRAEYINITVKNVDEYNVWARCLGIYLMSYTGKHSRVDKALELLTLAEIESREDLLCVATTLLVFNKLEELILLLEIYINAFSDSLIYCTLLLGYALTKNIKKFKQSYKTVCALSKDNNELIKWLEYIKLNVEAPIESISVIIEFKKILVLHKETHNPMYDPIKYHELYIKMKRIKPKLNRKYIPIIDCAIEHREIMYTQYYKKEIIEILNDCLENSNKPLEYIDDEVVAYSAALEYIYCKLYFIGIEKADLLRKYNLTFKSFNEAHKRLKT